MFYNTLLSSNMFRSLLLSSSGKKCWIIKNAKGSQIVPHNLTIWCIAMLPLSFFSVKPLLSTTSKHLTVVLHEHCHQDVTRGRKQALFRHFVFCNWWHWKESLYILMTITHVRFGLSLFLNYPCILFPRLLRIIESMLYIK